MVKQATSDGTAAQGEVRVRLQFARGTTNFYRYDSPDDRAAVTSIYVRRKVLGNSPPSWLVLRLEPSKAFSAPAISGRDEK